MPITNYLPSSRLIQPGVCTSTTRPATPFEGQAIFETDTDRMLIWNGTTWVVPNAPAQNPTGLEFITTGTATSQTSINVDYCFTSTYNNYRLVFSKMSTENTGRAFRFNYRVGTTTNTDSNYRYAYRGLKVNGATNDTSLSSSSFAEIGVYLDSFASTDFGSSVVDVYSPKTTNRTHATVNAQGYEGDYYYRAGGFVFGATNQFDGFSISLSGSGTFNLEYAVYGYRK